ncbi:uncharacterized protein BDZ99DRAFT_540076 [Mytilinidion resinicola]|uniref:Uncharacterized protein n=1 Tax=Mytilinidion resinicola TaxID=574789 RepID=A0A6A6YAI5_9PEZI|nr:uncharacterized protein BDZ99DRAFT_540076 [Mytilinidion resinicola]KAF2805578.1 hypothetical protein BDZ99DRAFT_540076 [Mytilinidion resinicola]
MGERDFRMLTRHNSKNLGPDKWPAPARGIIGNQTPISTRRRLGGGSACPLAGCGGCRDVGLVDSQLHCWGYNGTAAGQRGARVVYQHGTLQLASRRRDARCGDSGGNSGGLEGGARRLKASTHGVDAAAVGLLERPFRLSPTHVHDIWASAGANFRDNGAIRHCAWMQKVLAPRELEESGA